MKILYTPQPIAYTFILCFFLIMSTQSARLFAMQIDDCSPGTITGESNLCTGSDAYQFQITGATALGTWSSLDESIATVNSSGSVKPVGRGSTKIRYTVPSNCDLNGFESTDFDITVISAGTIAGSNGLAKGITMNLSASNASDGGVWASSDESVVRINYALTDVYIEISPLKGGTSTISYTVSAGGCTARSEFTATVYDPDELSIEVPDNVCFKYGDDPIIVAAPKAPSGASWALAPTDIARIDNRSGALTVNGTGTILIALYVFSPYRATVHKTINVNYVHPIDGVESITVSKLEDFQRTYQYVTDNPPGGTWRSSNPEVATINEAGLLTPVSVGNTTISYITDFTCTPNLAEKTISIVSGGLLSGPSDICGPGTGPYQYEVTATTAGGVWASGNENVATIDQNGLLTPHDFGGTTISYTPPGSSVSTEMVVNVFAIRDILGPRNICLTEEYFEYFVLGSSPDFADWTSSNTDVATIDIFGGVTLKNPGTTRITYRAESQNCGTITLSKTLSVGALEETVEFDGEDQVLVPGINPLVDVCTEIGRIAFTGQEDREYGYVRVSTFVMDNNVEYMIDPYSYDETVAADLVLYYYQEDFDRFNKTSDIKLPTGPDDTSTLANLRIRHESGYGFPIETLRPTSVVWNEAYLRWEVAFSVTHFSYFYLDAVNAGLPVTLVSFDAAKQENGVALSWLTSMETNSESFEIQHSTNVKSWQKLGIVKAEGESQADKKYSYLDKSPSNGDNFYRLKMIDQVSDGGEKAFTYSKIQHVTFEKIFAAHIFPNPAIDRFDIETPHWEEVRSIQIYNRNGTAVYKSTGNNPGKTVDIKAVPAGTYLMKLTLKNGDSKTLKIVIVR